MAYLFSHLSLFWHCFGIFLHPSPSCGCLSNCYQLKPASLISPSADRRQLILSRPLLRFPCGVHLKACLVVLVVGSYRVWPSQPQRLPLICNSTLSCPVVCHKSHFEIVSGQDIFRIVRRLIFPQQLHFFPWGCD